MGTTPLFMTRPINKIEQQLAIKKPQPTSTLAGKLEICITSCPVAFSKDKNPSDRPIKILNIGPAKQAVMAIFAKPFLAILTSATKSEIELPHARMVIPITELCNNIGGYEGSEKRLEHER